MSMPAQKPGRSKQDYATPAEFIRAVKRRLDVRGEFFMDFAASADNAKAFKFVSEQADGLSMSFKDRMTLSGAPAWRTWNWLNPPFADIAPWAAACAQFKRDGGQVAFLVPTSVGANWFRDHVHGQALVLALNGRLAFIEGKPRELYPKDCMLCLYSPWVSVGFDVWDWKKELEKR